MSALSLAVVDEMPTPVHGVLLPPCPPVLHDGSVGLSRRDLDSDRAGLTSWRTNSAGTQLSRLIPASRQAWGHLVEACPQVAGPSRVLAWTWRGSARPSNADPTRPPPRPDSPRPAEGTGQDSVGVSPSCPRTQSSHPRTPGECQEPSLGALIPDWCGVLSVSIAALGVQGVAPPLASLIRLVSCGHTRRPGLRGEVPRARGLAEASCGVEPHAHQPSAWPAL